MQGTETIAKEPKRFGPFGIFWRTVGGMAGLLFCVTMELCFLSPYQGVGWGPPQSLMWCMYGIELAVGGVLLICPPLLVWLAISKTSRVAAAASYFGILAVYIFLLSNWYAPWVPLQQNMGNKTEIGGVMWLSTSVYAISVFWFFERPTLPRFKATWFLSLSAVLLMFFWIDAH